METPKIGKIFLEIDGLYYPQTVFDAMINQVMGSIIQRIIRVKKTPEAVHRAVRKLQTEKIRKVVYQEAMNRTKKSIPGLKAQDADESLTLLPLQKAGKSS